LVGSIMARILIVDDAQFIRATLRAMSESLGHEIIGEADSGAEALKILETAAPDVILLDLLLPDVSGLELMPKIRRKFPLIKVIMITAVGQKQICAQALRAGCNDLLNKPFSYEDFTQKLQSVLEQ